MRPMKMWGGFVDGKIDTWRDKFSYRGPLRRVSIYMSQREAAEDYEDVRQIEIREVPAKRRRPER